MSMYLVPDRTGFEASPQVHQNTAAVFFRSRILPQPGYGCERRGCLKYSSLDFSPIPVHRPNSAAVRSSASCSQCRQNFRCWLSAAFLLRSSVPHGWTLYLQRDLLLLREAAGRTGPPLRVVWEWFGFPVGWPDAEVTLVPAGMNVLGQLPLRLWLCVLLGPVWLCISSECILRSLTG